MNYFLISNNNFSNEVKNISNFLFKELELSNIIETNNENDDSFVYIKTRSIKRLKSERFEILFDGYLKCRDQKELENNLLEKAFSICDLNVNIENEFSGIYNIVIKDNYKDTITLASDPSCLFPIYYVTKSETFYACSHSHILGKLLDLSPDYLGLFQKVTFGYSIGATTYYDGLYRVNPGEIIQICNRTTRKTVIKSFSYFTSGYNEFKRPQDVLFQLLFNSFKYHKETCEDFGLMLSEGFDSRLIGGFASKLGFNISTFTHGTYGTKGSKIVEEVADLLNADHKFDSLVDGFPSTSKGLSKQLFLSDNLNIAYWINGAEYFNKSNSPILISCGTALDSTLGGHIFYKPSKPRFNAVLQRYSEIISQDLGLVNDNYIEKLSSLILNNFLIIDKSKSRRLLNYKFNNDVSNTIFSKFDDLKDSINDEFTRLKSTGSLRNSEILQRFFLENRVRKFSFGQEMTLRMFNNLIVPSYEFSFMSISSQIHPKYKLHHKLYLKLMNKYFPELSKIKNGGYGLSAIFPRIILESSRFGFRFMDELHMKKLMKKKGEYQSSNFRPVLVSEFNVRNNKCLNDLEDIINNYDDFINHQSLRKSINQIKNYEKRAFNLNEFYDSFEYNQIFKRKL